MVVTTDMSLFKVLLSWCRDLSDVKAGKAQMSSCPGFTERRVGGDGTFHTMPWMTGLQKETVLTNPHYTSGLFVQTVLLKTGVFLRFHFSLKGKTVLFGMAE